MDNPSHDIQNEIRCFAHLFYKAVNIFSQVDQTFNQVRCCFFVRHPHQGSEGWDGSIVRDGSSVDVRRSLLRIWFSLLIWRTVLFGRIWNCRYSFIYWTDNVGIKRSQSCQKSDYLLKIRLFPVLTLISGWNWGKISGNMTHMKSDTWSVCRKIVR